MGSKFTLKNGQDQEFSLVHNDNAGAILIATDKIVYKDANGNVGIGVVPSAWIKKKAIQIGVAGSLSANINDTPTVYLSSNIYTDGTWADRYISTAPASSLVQYNGGFIWSTAPSGTAGQPIPWTNAMTLEANGNLLVGTTTDNGVDKLQVNGSISQGEITAITVDLNTLKTLTKTYVVQHTSENRPIDDYGYLEIIVHGAGVWVMQRFTTLGATGLGTGRIFVRCLVNGTWSAWVEK